MSTPTVFETYSKYKNNPDPEIYLKHVRATIRVKLKTQKGVKTMVDFCLEIFGQSDFDEDADDLFYSMERLILFQVVTIMRTRLVCLY